MPRSLSAVVSSSVVQAGTVPIYLVSLGYTPIIRLSTNGTRVWNGQTWSDSGVKVSQLRRTSGGGQAGSIQLPNHDNGFGAIVLGAGIRDIPVDIYQVYGDAPHAAADAEHLFSGHIDAVPSIDDFVSMSLISAGAVVQRTPRITLATFLGSSMPVPGTRIVWAGDVLVLESQQ